MAMELRVIKTPAGALVPADSESAEMLSRVKTGRALRMKSTQMRERNVRFFRKWWALVDFAFDNWEPAELDDPRWKGVTPEKTKDRFRKDLTILAGYYEASYRVDGSVRIEAKSIAFGRMSEDEFERLYSNTINAVLKHILTHYDRDQLDAVVEQILRFD